MKKTYDTLVHLLSLMNREIQKTEDRQRQEALWQDYWDTYQKVYSNFLEVANSLAQQKVSDLSVSQKGKLRKKKREAFLFLERMRRIGR